jgi:2-dehydro-3-deoxyphosphogluconate aldolase / (4S)-4-hydroxy-2-oxoglutarate aldolase
MSPLFDPELGHRISDCGIVAVLILDRVEDAVQVARALVAGGINAIELTFRTLTALEALKAIRAEVPEVIAGAGTILNADQVRAAKEAGAHFGVAPGMNPKVLAAAQEAGFSFAPGIATPSDIEAALEFDCRLLKFFPAEPSGGLPYLNSIAAPYLHFGIKFIPLGGLNPSNMASYLQDSKIAALGGSWLAPRDLINGGSWKEITELASSATATIRSLRGGPCQAKVSGNLSRRS